MTLEHIPNRCWEFGTHPGDTAIDSSQDHIELWLIEQHLIWCGLVAIVPSGDGCLQQPTPSEPGFISQNNLWSQARLERLKLICTRTPWKFSLSQSTPEWSYMQEILRNSQLTYFLARSKKIVAKDASPHPYPTQDQHSAQHTPLIPRDPTTRLHQGNKVGTQIAKCPGVIGRVIHAYKRLNPVVRTCFATIRLIP